MPLNRNKFHTTNAFLVHIRLKVGIKQREGNRSEIVHWKKKPQCYWSNLCIYIYIGSYQVKTKFKRNIINNLVLFSPHSIIFLNLTSQKSPMPWTTNIRWSTCMGSPGNKEKIIYMCISFHEHHYAIYTDLSKIIASSKSKIPDQTNQNTTFNINL